jgi:hypothetical protein
MNDDDCGNAEAQKRLYNNHIAGILGLHPPEAAVFESISIFTCKGNIFRGIKFTGATLLTSRIYIALRVLLILSPTTNAHSMLSYPVPESYEKCG